MDSLFHLPPELFRHIIDMMDLHDEFVLSQTGRGLRCVFSRNWDEALAQLSPEDRLRFWAGLASISPDHWACPRCCRLHRVDTSDTPSTPQDPPCGAQLSLRRISEGGYSLRQNHMQTALKLSRMGNSHQEYLARLMSPHRFSFTTECVFQPQIRETYTAKPRIINGRFILREEWVITDEKNVARPLLHNIIIPSCPHLCVIGKGVINSKYWKRRGGRLARQANPNAREIILLEEAIENAIRYRGVSIICSCPRCPTDYEVCVSESGRMATIRAWHDFGGEGTPMDTGLNLHVRNAGVSDWIDQGPRSGHVPGSIERLWLDTHR
ncbi:uncharacterized protein Triagg1_2285 [Trichoderma aggressivum f. europaeum]|uniref:F-box domain-containing protein n=1 Tax=Trichoderma aggressivum f. europaeum TaxID=173218 RepID=A0AAE1IGS0_9HYPO|nr:hypothetical protein Triagg1_2285 [Trichoderma aggressivum f. europaeum]